MPVATQEIIALLCTLAEEEKLRVTCKEALKGGLIAGTMATAGGLALGPIGIALGGTLGGCIAAVMSHNKFLPVVEVIANMQEERRDVLAQNVRRIMSNIDVTDIAVFAAMVAGDLSIRNRVVGVLIDYLRTEMSLAIIEN